MPAKACGSRSAWPRAIRDASRHGRFGPATVKVMLDGIVDWAVSSADPLQGIHVAVNRRRADLDVRPFFPEQRISPATG